MAEEVLALEQQLQLRLLRDELAAFSREELIEVVLEERHTLFVERRWHRIILDAAGIEVCQHEGKFSPLPETEEEMLEIFGRVPSNDELAAFVNERLEAARMDDVDIEAIALGLED